MFSIIYIRSLVGIIAIGLMMCYLQSDNVVEAIAGIVAIVYIDRDLSGDADE